MAGTIEICRLRNIQKLRFEIPDRGVWLLTAGNGAGKTSLLACIRRIGWSNAFPVHFPSSLRSDRLDNHSGGSVTYEINGEKVEYAYRGERWTPRPRGNSRLFDRLGYPLVTYIGATAERITPRPEDFEPRLVRNASRHIIEAANRIFETNKFSALRTVNLAPGVGNDAFVLAIQGNPVTYHSEKHFSLGELCILKLLKLLRWVPNNSLIVIDELEMALHPRAQIKLLEYLVEQADNKHLTIIFSTHSVTLLKASDRRKIIYLEKQDDGETKPIVGCFPTYAIGNIAAEEETLPDIVIYVEDLFAKDMVLSFFDQFFNERIDDPSMRPTLKVLPIGGFQEVVSFLGQNQAVLPDRCRQQAMLDGDVSQETLVAWRVADKHARLAKFQRLEDKISYLPWTPELGLVTYMLANVAAFEQSLRRRFGDNQIRIRETLRLFDQDLNGGPLRRSAKATCESLIEYLCQRTGRGEEAVRDDLCREFASASWDQQRPEFLRIFAPLV